MRNVALCVALMLSAPAGARQFRRQLGTMSSSFPTPLQAGSTASTDLVTLLATVPAASECTNANIATTQGTTVSVARASTSICQKTDGTYVVISANKPVVEGAGLRIEPASTNLLAYSDDLSAWTATNVTMYGPVTSSASLPPGSAGTGTLQEWDTSASGGYLESDSFVINSTSAVLSSWTYSLGSETAVLILRDTSANANRCTISIGAAHDFESTMTGRKSCSSASITSGNTHVARLYPGGLAGTGSAVSVYGVQVEAGRTSKTSYMATSGSTATRNGDAVSVVITDNSTAGCASAYIKALTPSSSQRLFVKGSDMLSLNAVSQVYSGDGTNTVFTGGGASDITGRTVPVRVTWSVATGIALNLDNAASGTGSFDGTMGSGTTLYIGNNTGVVHFFDGWMKAIKVGSTTTGCAL